MNANPAGSRLSTSAAEKLAVAPRVQAPSAAAVAAADPVVPRVVGDRQERRSVCECAFDRDHAAKQLRTPFGRELRRPAERAVDVLIDLLDVVHERTIARDTALIGRDLLARPRRVIQSPH